MFRRKLIDLANRNPEAAEDLWQMCREDLLFFINAFVWTYDPRLKPYTVIPFITYEYQDDILLDTDAAIGCEDLIYLKSRATAGTWMPLVTFLWRWLFHYDQSFLLMSRVEDLVDKRDDRDGLFPKLDLVLKYLPAFLVPPLVRVKNHLHNCETNSVIDGCSTTGNAGRGGRRTSVLVDELAAFKYDDGFKVLASMQHVSLSRLFPSTPQGMGNSFEKIVHDGGIRVVEMHWSSHPVYRRGLYGSTVDGQLRILDPDFWCLKYSSRELQLEPADLPDAIRTGVIDYPFTLDGKVRSPWYDNECRRTPIPSLIAQELDMEFLGSGSPFFDTDVLRRVEHEYCRPPLLVGDLLFEPDTCEILGFRKRANGPLRMWIRPGVDEKLPTDRNYACGADISAGTGASDSYLAVYDVKTGEKVAAYRSSLIRPEAFAETCVAICKWFKGASKTGAKLGWEVNGPGNQFGGRVIELGYRNVFYRYIGNDPLKGKSSDPGWYSTQANKKSLLGKYELALARGELVNRDTTAIQEAYKYVHVLGDKIEHRDSQSKLDITGSGENHGDAVIGDAVANLVRGEVASVRQPKSEIPQNCLAYRMARARREEELALESWN